MRGFTEALCMEMMLERRAVGVTCVHPGGIRTNIVRTSRQPAGHSPLHRDPQLVVAEFETQLARNTPEYCARAILRAVQRNQGQLQVGADARLLDRVARWLPRWYPSLVVAILRRQWGL